MAAVTYFLDRATIREKLLVTFAISVSLMVMGIYYYDKLRHQSDWYHSRINEYKNNLADNKRLNDRPIISANDSAQVLSTVNVLEEVNRYLSAHENLSLIDLKIVQGEVNPLIESYHDKKSAVILKISGHKDHVINYLNDFYNAYKSVIIDYVHYDYIADAYQLSMKFSLVNIGG